MSNEGVTDRAFSTNVKFSEFRRGATTGTQTSSADPPAKTKEGAKSSKNSNTRTVNRNLGEDDWLPRDEESQENATLKPHDAQESHNVEKQSVGEEGHDSQHHISAFTQQLKDVAHEMAHEVKEFFERPSHKDEP